MTLRQDTFINKLPENGYNISKTARAAGYTVGSSKAGSLYKSLQKKIIEAYNPESVKGKILKAEAKFLKDNDNSNYARMIELLCKITGLTKDTATQQFTAYFTQVTDDLPRVQVEEPKQVDSP